MSSAGRVGVDGSCPVLIGRSFGKDLDEVAEFFGNLFGGVDGLGDFGPDGIRKVLSKSVNGHFDRAGRDIKDGGCVGLGKGRDLTY
ncbi:hypothetical protein N9227_00315 [bacterium]|nr:hypothetical protein [bacterium]